MRYTSTVVPRIGETISIARANKSWRVVEVDYLVKEMPGYSESEPMILDLVTVKVELA